MKRVWKIVFWGVLASLGSILGSILDTGRPRRSASGSKMPPRGPKHRKGTSPPPPRRETKIDKKSIWGHTFLPIFLEGAPGHVFYAFWVPKVLKNSIPEGRFLYVGWKKSNIEKVCLDCTGVYGLHSRPLQKGTCCEEFSSFFGDECPRSLRK